MEAADGSLHCASHFKHKEGGTLPSLCQVRCIVLQGEFGTRKGKNNVVFKGMLTTLNVSKLASRRQCKFCTDLPLNSGEGESSLFPKHVRNQFKTVYEAQWHPVQCIYEFSCCVSTHFCCSVHTRPGMKAFLPSLTFLHPLLPGGIILPVWEGKC